MKVKYIALFVFLLILTPAGCYFLLYSPLFQYTGNMGKEEVSASVIAHRGYHRDCPENTLSAIQNALDHGMNEIEIDLHQTKDGVIIIHHNFMFSGQPGLTGRVRDVTWEQIQMVNRKMKFGIPRLEDALKLVDGKAELILEPKAGNSYYPSIEEHLIRLIDMHRAHSWVKIHSFSDEVLMNLKNLSPSLELHKLLVAYFPSMNLMIDDGIKFTQLDTYNYVDCFSLNYLFADRGIIRLLKSRKKKINVWNLNDPEIGRWLDAQGINGIITDEPELFKNTSD